MLEMGQIKNIFTIRFRPYILEKETHINEKNSYQYQYV